MISYTFVPMAKVERLRALERQPIYTPTISMPTPSRTPSRVGTVYTTVTPAIKEARDREYISSLFRGARDEASSVYSDPNMRLLFTSIRDWTGIEPIKQAFPRMRRPIEILESLRRDAAADRGWWETYFCPPEHERVSRLQESLDNPVDSFVREHPEFLLGPVSLGLQGLETAGAIAIQRVAPKLLAVGIVATSWENFVNYMKGGKDAVRKSSSATPDRVTQRYGEGKHWDSLITDRTSANKAGVAPKDVDTILGRIQRAKRQIGGDIRADANGNLYKFDKGHQSAKVHLEKIVEREGKFWGVAEVDPITGRVTTFVKRRPY